MTSKRGSPSNVHKIADVWAQLNHQDQKIHEIAKDQATSHEKLVALEGSMNQNFLTLKSSLKEINSQVASLANTVHSPPKTNWVGIMSVLVVLSVAVGSLIQTRLSPMESLLELHNDISYEYVEKMAIQREKTYWLEKEQNSTEQFIDGLSERFLSNETRIATIEGSVTELKKQVEDIDKGGSRVWNDSINTLPE